MRMLSALPIGLLAFGVAAVASAQDADTTSSDLDVDIKAPRRAFELSVEGGYTQPFGRLREGEDIHSVVEAGGAAGLRLGYRFTPHWSLEGVTQYHDSTQGDIYGEGDRVDIRGVSAGIQGTYHFLPYKRVDPYASLGAGYRAMWIAPESESTPNTLIHGIQALRASFGVDFRVSEDVALGPLVGADMTVFLREAPQSGEDETIDSPRPSTFLFAGVAGRFDMGGQRVPVDEPVVAMLPVPTPAAGPPPARVERKPEVTGIRIDPAILDACKIEGPKAFFEFDKSDLQATDQTTLNQVAECFATGPLKGRKLNVTGRADPRGTDAYNRNLGQSRAESVSEHLSWRGVTPEAIKTESRGEADAMGEEEAGWAFDRRVDLTLEKP